MSINLQISAACQGIRVRCVGVSTRAFCPSRAGSNPFRKLFLILEYTRVEYILRVDYLLSTGNFLLLEIISSKFTIILPGTVSRGQLFLDEYLSYVYTNYFTKLAAVVPSPKYRYLFTKRKQK